MKRMRRVGKVKAPVKKSVGASFNVNVDQTQIKKKSGHILAHLRQ